MPLTLDSCEEDLRWINLLAQSPEEVRDDAAVSYVLARPVMAALKDVSNTPSLFLLHTCS